MFPFREATNQRGIHRGVVRRLKREDEVTPKTIARTLAAALTPATATKSCEAQGKENEKDSIVTPAKQDLFGSPFLLRAISDSEVAPLLTVVLDLDETLVSNRRLDLPAAILRPYVLESLNALRQLTDVEVVMWTASTEDTAAPVVRQLSTRGNVFDDVIFRNDAWFTEPYHTKDLRLLGRPMDRIVVFDNAPNCCKMNKANSVLVEDFTGYFNPADNTLINLYRIVEVLVRDIRRGSSVQDSLASLADEAAVCRSITYQLPEAWRHVDVSEMHPLQVPPFGDFFKVQITSF
jgi:hypothetical protein